MITMKRAPWWLAALIGASPGYVACGKTSEAAPKAEPAVAAPSAAAPPKGSAVTVRVDVATLGKSEHRSSVYNLLPPAIKNHRNVRDFQTAAQNVIKERLKDGCEDWAQSFSPRISQWRHLMI